MESQAERLTIEEQTARWADQRRERMLAHAPTRAVRVIKEETQREIAPFPTLAWEDPHPYPLKFDPSTGEILVPVWREAKIIKNNGQRSLAEPEGLIQLRRRREHLVDFRDLPDRKVVVLNYLRANNLEAAIRQQVHIIDAYRSEGKETEQIDQVWAWLDLQLKATLTGGINKKTLSALARQTAGFLESSGLTEVRNLTKKKISKRLAQAASLDSLDRVNPLVMRTRIRSAYLEAVKREMLSVLVSEKFEPFLAILLMEREYTRQVIKGAVEDLDTMVGFTKRGAAPFIDGKSSGVERQGMKKVLGVIARSLAEVRVLPYLPAARFAAINLVGCQEDKKELNRGIIGEPAGRLFAHSPVTEYITTRYFREAKGRIKNWSYGPLIDCLKENEEIGMEIT